MDSLFQVGWSKGELDFRVRGDVCALTLEQMNQFRAMLVAGIGTMEDMWRRAQESKHPASTSRESQQERLLILEVAEGLARWCPMCNKTHRVGEHDPST